MTLHTYNDQRNIADVETMRSAEIEALRNALDIVSRRVVELERQLAQRDDMIESLRRDVNEHRD